jgi:dinuclear metal center YbgI/SA1388 family protein
MILKEIIGCIEDFAPLVFQEDYDNSGLLTGNAGMEVTGALLTLDCTEEVLEEAIAQGCNVVIAHHPVIFSGLKKLTGGNYVERTILKAITSNIAIYACHTNIDNVHLGVNRHIADKLGMVNCRVLSPKDNLLRKLVTFVPESHHQQVMDAVFAAGAGGIGNYSECSYNTEGFGTFKGNENSDPFVGKRGERAREKEIRFETIFDVSKEGPVKKALLAAHPYEEPAYDIYPVNSQHPQVGSGLKGELREAMTEEDFLRHVKTTFKVPFVKHTRKTGRKVLKVAVCGGSGRFLLKDAIKAGVDAFITSDFKYHEFFDADGRLLLVDTGHYESEQFTPEIFYRLIKEKFSTFAIHLSKTNTNPVNYF